MESDIEIMDEYVNKNDENIKKYKNDLKIEINKLLLKEWSFLSEDWKKISNTFKHRTELKNVKCIDEIKKELLDKLGYTSVYFFLTVLYTNKEYPGPYYEIEKGLLILYHLVTGFTSKETKQFIPYSTFYTIYKEFWITNYEKLNKFVDYCLKNMFSNIKIRILSAKIKNPKHFKNITLLLDGHDSSINYSKPDISFQKKWSFKLKKSGIRTQILCDINEMAILISKSSLCGNSSDGGMMLNMKLYNVINKEDCIALDGGYTLFIKQFEDLCKERNYDLCDNNFFYPIRKENNIRLTKQEEHYNDVFGSFRSIIEQQFCDLQNKYKRFDNNNSMLKADDIKYINLQIKVSFLLKNIQKFCDKFNIITQEHHKLWMNVNFEFPTDAKLIDIVYTNEMEQLEKLRKLNKIQNDLLNLNICDVTNINDNMNIDDTDEDEKNDKNNNDSDVDFPQYNNPIKKRKKRFRKNKGIDIYNIRNINKDDDIFEVEDIIDHKINEHNSYVFWVKWKNYDSSENTWVDEVDFREKDIIKKYFKNKKIIYKV